MRDDMMGYNNNSIHSAHSRMDKLSWPWWLVKHQHSIPAVNQLNASTKCHQHCQNYINTTHTNRVLFSVTQMSLLQLDFADTQNTCTVIKSSQRIKISATKTVSKNSKSGYLISTHSASDSSKLYGAIQISYYYYYYYYY